MSGILQRIRSLSETIGDRVCYCTRTKKNGEYISESITLLELEEKSNQLAKMFSEGAKEKSPVVVFGHKTPFMVISFLGCVKSGRAYVPIDCSLPVGRAKDIIDAINPQFILMPEEDEQYGNDTIEQVRNIAESLDGCKLINKEQLTEIFNSEKVLSNDSLWVKPEDNFYILFTSGSTGKPKGVQITAACVDNFLEWAVTFGEGSPLLDGGHHKFINQAPFTFDLSVFDIFMTLYTGGTLYGISKSMQSDLAVMYDFLGKSDADVWLSTPSFGEIALADEQFNESLMPNMKLFLFAGESLTNQTVSKMNVAFPKAEVMNIYGPTEATVVVTGVSVTPKIRDSYNPLPIGISKPNTYIYIMDEKGNILPDGEKGEIVIVGDTVSLGYWKNEEKTCEMFDYMEVDGVNYRLYHTHDKGYYQDGLIFYCGRIDLQIKLHGYRIELEDIESNLLKADNIERVVVMPDYVGEEIVGITAYVVPKNPIDSALKERQRLRNSLKKVIPEYMIPKKFIFRDTLPMTNNGKVDRKKLKELSDAAD